MQLSMFKSKFRHLFDVLKNRSELDIYSEKDFLKLLEIERERANRNNHPFSLIIFDLRFISGSRLSTKKIIKHISLRMRKIDVIGCYGPEQLGLILPYTTSKGAEELIKVLTNLFGIKIPEASCKVFTYPADKIRNKNINEDLKRIA
jgi:hypothetical protein